MKRFAKILSIITVLSLVIYAFQQGAFATVADSNWIADYLAEQGDKGLVVLFLIGAAYTSVGGPRQFMAFAFGFALGGIKGALIGSLSALLGCVITFYFARWVFRSSLKKRFQSKLTRLENLIIHRTILKMIMIRILPLSSNFLTNLVAGSTHISAWRFFTGSGIGFIPQMMVFSFAGAGVGLSDNTSLLISGGLFLCASIIAFYLYKTRLRQQISEIIEEK
ncbi:TVP38/TMEM64 family protein [Shewanella pealeana]|uniref:TVP38/TMEM64 family membrane protein n=1 Tax=Shewanella pealeana (strain ATCC 700345 / ANG-SQ1) TaxID=398579 RepID=A8HA28_SHEPA|nr:VTT domain-containing protein [Shewanella pealeana]ABV89415.1 SNARE associated Golgi protein [Shewanella pealeana ATCC 700345]